MMMVFGLFVFELRTLPYQQLQLSRNWRHVKNDRVGRSAKWQYVGAGENQLTLGGLLYPEITGGNLSLGAVSTMAYTGLAWPLIDGVGSIYGMYVITGLQETHQEFDRKRAARTVLTGMCYSVGSATRQGSSSLTRFIGQSAMTSRT